MISSTRFWLILSLVLYAGVRIWGVSQKQGFYFDDVATVITTSGKAIEISDSSRAIFENSEWVQAGTLQQLYDQHKVWNFRSVSRKLAERDIHPPLYFWLTHGWRSVFGFGHWPLQALQWLLEIILAGFVWAIATRLTHQKVHT